eukprot:gene1363-biopygen10821
MKVHHRAPQRAARPRGTAQPTARRQHCPALSASSRIHQHPRALATHRQDGRVAKLCRDPRRFSTAHRSAPSSTHRRTGDASITLAPSPALAWLAHCGDIQLVK